MDSIELAPFQISFSSLSSRVRRQDSFAPSSVFGLMDAQGEYLILPVLTPNRRRAGHSPERCGLDAVRA
jgi:hypothetical protein